MLRRASRVRSSSAWTDLNRPAARPEACDPAVWRSTTTTDRPASAQCRAVLRPSAPAPMTTTSASIRPLCRKPNGPGFSQTETCWLLSLVKGCRAPSLPPVAQPHPGQLRHQVELRRPHVAERHGAVLALPVGELDVVPPAWPGWPGHTSKGHPAFLAAPARAWTSCPGGSRAGREPRHSMTKQPPGSRWRGGVAEAGDLRVLAGQVHDRVEHQVGQREGAVYRRGGHVADGRPGWPRRRAWRAAGPTMARESSMPCTSTPRRASGSAIRPVPMASSSARPPPASSARHPGRRLYRARSEDPGGAVVRRGDALAEVTVFILHCPDVTPAAADAAG